MKKTATRKEVFRSMMKEKIVVITGASSGVGKETAFRCSAAGAKTILISRNEEKLMKVCKKISLQKGQADYYTLDVGHPEEVKVIFNRIMDKYGRVDILINCAGFGRFEPFVSSTIKDAERMFSVNVIGTMSCTHAVLPQMLARRSGHIVNVASIAGKLATAKSSVYSATKHAIIGFSNALRLETADYGVNVSVINPGPIRTHFFQRADPEGSYSTKIDRFMLDAEFVAEKIIQAIEERKREINIPWYMGLGAKFYQWFPRISERLGGRWMKMK
ncbi:SDR family oxidoreductase [Sporolactobacillus sp. THM19-2]|uniref:SDR family NAD(P)-dependent oxidoreductase n=1 Tax=Sporolactobacillus sp. THM19-2 TaxID=2511171 RepID=UPI001980AF0F|nr:SDR family oxidoreductase [Sporolactobacillus sp. THM19-2]